VLVARFVLVHGSWHGAWVWDPVGDELRGRGHEAVAPELPIDDVKATWQNYADHVIEAVGGCAGETVVVGHSAGAIPVAIAASQAAPRLTVYLTPSNPARELPPGRPERFKPEIDAVIKYDDQGRDYLDAEDAVSLFYPRLDQSTAQWAASRLRPQADTGDVPLDRPPPVASVFVYALHDEVFTTEGMVWSAKHVFGVNPIAIDTGHTPQLEAPKELADLLEKLATRH
jgi:pimeloyl-ACP methyl ester carboxylesterase